MKAPGIEMAHSKLLCKTRLTSRELRQCIETLIERQAVLCHEQDSGYHNKVSLIYSLNPVLSDLDIQ